MTRKERHRIVWGSEIVAPRHIKWGWLEWAGVVAAAFLAAMLFVGR